MYVCMCVSGIYYSVAGSWHPLRTITDYLETVSGKIAVWSKMSLPFQPEWSLNVSEKRKIEDTFLLSLSHLFLLKKTLIIQNDNKMSAVQDVIWVCNGQCGQWSLFKFLLLQISTTISQPVSRVLGTQTSTWLVLNPLVFSHLVSRLSRS